MASTVLEKQASRAEFVLSHLDVSKRGIEIAPYFNPLVSKQKYDVWYVDCIDNAEIQKKAAANPGAVGKTPPKIDSVWVPGQRLKRCVGNQTFNYAVASHVFEHVPNPIGWANQILECLEPGGRLALLIPSRLYSMDYYRRETTFGELMGWYIDNPSIPTTGQIMDFLSQSFEDRADVDFNQDMLPFSEARRHYSDADALNYATWVHNEKRYLDAHCTVWTAESFMEVFSRVRDLKVMNVDFIGPFVDFPNAGKDEFLVYLEKRA